MKSTLLLLTYFIFGVFCYSQNIEEMMDLGHHQMKTGDFPNAIDNFTKVIAIDKEQLDAYFLRGYSYNLVGEYDKALTDIRVIITKLPSAFIYGVNAMVRKNMGDYQGALEDYNFALEMDNFNAEIYRKRGELKYFDLNNRTSGCEDWEIANNLGEEYAPKLIEEYCQRGPDPVGALKTKDGYLLYYNFPKNVFTVDLKEHDIELDHYPIIRFKNTGALQILSFKSNSQTNNNETLIDEMNLEIEYYEEDFEKKISSNNYFKTVDGLNVNFWSFSNPLIAAEDSGITSIEKYYWADFIYRNSVYRVHFSSLHNDDKKAEKLLVKIIRSFRFYNNPLNFERLSDNVKMGSNFYSE